MPDVAEQEVDLIAKRHPETGEPLLGDCNMHIGDGTQIVVFKKGMAKVPLSVAQLLMEKRSDLDCPALTGGQAAPPADPLEALSPEERAAVHAVREAKAADAAPADPEPEEVQPHDDDEAAKLAAAEKAPPPAEPPHGAKPLEPGTPEHQAALDAAREHLEDEGEEVPDPLPQGERTDAKGEALVAKTDEGATRCQALKTDGEQCKNPAADDGHACNLDTHKAQLEDAAKK